MNHLVARTKTLLFDIDGTLIDSGGSGGQAMRDSLQRVFQLDEPKRVPMHGRTDHGIIGELFQVNGIPDDACNRQRFIEAYFERLPEVLVRAGGRVLPGVFSLLDRLESQCVGFTSTLLTGNMARSAMLKLSHFRLDRYFQGGVFGDLHSDRRELGKTAIAILNDQLGRTVSPTDLVVIGDTPLDIECARTIGCPVIAVATGGCAIEQLSHLGADLVVSTLADPAVSRWLEST